MDAFKLIKFSVRFSAPSFLLDELHGSAIFAPVMPEKPGYRDRREGNPEGGAKEQRPVRADRKTVADRFGRRRGPHRRRMPPPPHLRRKLPTRRPESLRRHRDKGRGARFNFSADEGQGGEWSYDHLSKFIANPKALFRAPHGFARHPEGQRAPT